jgi:hypothetical protein
MADYCCYFLDDLDHVTGVESLSDRASDADAIALALRILVERDYHPSVEIWDGDRLVAKHAMEKSQQHSTLQACAA